MRGFVRKPDALVRLDVGRGTHTWPSSFIPMLSRGWKRGVRATRKFG
jgi:hypothetical protein